MEGRTKLCLLVLLVLLASTTTTLAEQKCVKETFHSIICMKWQCRMECQDNHPGKIIYDAYCTVKHFVVRYCNCLVCLDSRT